MRTFVMLIAGTMFSSFSGAVAETAETAEIKHIRNDATGGSCNQIGIWNPASKTCTLTTDSSNRIIIDSDDITLDGGGHTLYGNGTEIANDAVTVTGKTGVTIKNLTFRDFSYGVHLVDAGRNTVSNITAIGNLGAGISLTNASDNTLTNNRISNDHSDTGICIGFRSSNNVITGTTVTGADRGIYLHDMSDGNTISGNTLTNNIEALTLYDSDSNNVIAGNNISTNSSAIFLHSASNSNTISGNTILGNGRGIYLAGGPSLNRVFHNNFLDNVNLQAKVNDGAGNIFSEPFPGGGNYWSDFDTPGEGCNDDNKDGFCDSPYVFAGGQDERPQTSQDGGKCAAPALGLYNPAVAYWSSFGDYQNHELSIEWKLANLGGAPARDVSLVANYHSNGVTTVSRLPLSFGHIAAMGGWGMVTVKALVPAGVSSFRSVVYVQAEDDCGGIHNYPQDRLPVL